MLFKRGAKPDKIPDASGKTVEDYWGPSKRIMGEPKFVDELNAFEKDDINAKMMKLIRDEYINNKEIDQDESKISTGMQWRSVCTSGSLPSRDMTRLPSLLLPRRRFMKYPYFIQFPS